jgi:transmembrane protein 231
MTGLVYLSGQGSAGRRLDVSGDIRLYQKQPLAHRGHDTRFLSSPLPSTAVAPLSLAAILRFYGQRNVSTRLENVYSIWGSGASTVPEFSVEAVVQYPAQEIVYTPGLWQTLKWGWVQYLALLVVFVYVMSGVKSYVFYHQILPTAQHVPWKQG